MGNIGAIQVRGNHGIKQMVLLHQVFNAFNSVIGVHHWICLRSCPGYYSLCSPSNSRTSNIILLTDVLTNMGQVNSFDHCRDKIDLFWCSTVTRESIWNINPEYDKGSDHWCPDCAADCALSQEHIKKACVSFKARAEQNMALYSCWWTVR